MSQYPYGYSFPGQPPQQQYPPYQQYGVYPPATLYGAQQPTPQPQQTPAYPPPTANYYAASQSAYDHNVSSIPGLGAPSTGPAFAAPNNGSWHQEGYGSTAPPAQFPAYSSSNPAPSTPHDYANSHGQAYVPQNSYPAPKTKSGYSGEQKKPESKSQTIEKAKEQLKPQVDEAEEGEISDSYFDDLYDDTPNQAPLTKEHVATTAKPSGDMVVDNSDQEPNFYDTDMEDPPGPRSIPRSPDNAQSHAKTAEGTERDRSRSYSPHLSPTEIQGDSQSPFNASGDPHNPAGSKLQSEPINQLELPCPLPVAAQDTSDPDHGVENRGQPGIAAKSFSPVTTPAKLFASLSEAQNEAKKAILRLLPHGVKYQTYIDEGFDGKVIKDLFTQLNLPSEPATSPSARKPTTTTEKDNQAPSDQVLQPSQVDTMAKKQEERKDKIARLLAEKKVKAAIAAAVPKPGATSTSTASAPTTKPPITRAEKDLLLQQKMAALRKKVVPRLASTQMSNPGTQKSIAPQESAVTSQSPARPSSTSGTPVSSAAQLTPVQNTMSKPATPGPLSAAPSPGVLSLPSVPRAAQQVNQRKRPVAADFMDYPLSAVKRTSLANRENSSLVISISDDEDDEDEDDDVEMEVESATGDSPVPSQQTLTLPRRGPAIRDFPPLTNTNATRLIPSPLHGSTTPGGRNANVDLKARELEIEEMKRKIEEMEARAKARPKKGSITPQTPSTGDATPMEQEPKPPTRRAVSTSNLDDKNSPPARLLQEAEAVSAPQASPALSMTDKEVRVRVSSAQTPGKSTKMLEKAERLKRMQEEMMRLQAEIDEDMAQERSSEEVQIVPDSIALEDSQSMLDSVEDSFDQATHSQIEGAASVLMPEVEQLAMDECPPDGALRSQPMETESPANVSAIEKVQDTDPEVILDPLQTQEDVIAADLSASDDYEPPETLTDDRPGVDSPPFNPAPSKIADNSELQTDVDMQTSSAEVPTHDHTVEQHTATVDTSREVHVVCPLLIERYLTNAKATDTSTPMPQTSFAPYESPLRYFHAYRFHPNYSDGVTGGLKSLTYSNRIDPKREMCPDEWEGNDCPRGDACQFQHFQNIIAPDNEIILELGSSEDLNGDQKKSFNNGLREIVASFQKAKVRDFRTIAQAIVEFRRTFFGDSSKVLPLEGVNI